MGSLHGFVSKDGRRVEIGQKVRIYRNLNKTEFYSIQDYKTKIVLGYAKSVTIGGGVQFKVSEKSRQRVLRDRRRNVHAFAIGLLQGTGSDIPKGTTSGYYNPYLTESFINEQTGEAISKSEIAHCQGTRVYFS